MIKRLFWLFRGCPKVWVTKYDGSLLRCKVYQVGKTKYVLPYTYEDIEPIILLPNGKVKGSAVFVSWQDND